MSDMEQIVNALPLRLQQRMARLVLGGWVIQQQGRFPSFTAHHNAFPEQLYSSSTLLTLLNQMETPLAETEAGVYDSMGKLLALPDGARTSADPYRDLAAQVYKTGLPSR